MYNLDEQYVKELLRDYSRAMVGRLCKQNELFEKDSSLTKSQSLNLLKEFNRELIYENFRDLLNNLKAYQAGKKFVKFNVYTPSDSE